MIIQETNIQSLDFHMYSPPFESPITSTLRRNPWPDSNNCVCANRWDTPRKSQIFGKSIIEKMRFYSRFRSFTWFFPGIFRRNSMGGNQPAYPTRSQHCRHLRCNGSTVARWRLHLLRQGGPFRLERGQKRLFPLLPVAFSLHPGGSWMSILAVLIPKYSSIFFPKIDPVWSSFFDRLHQLVWQYLLIIQWNSPENRFKKWPFDAIWEWFIWFPESQLVDGFNPSEKY